MSRLQSTIAAVAFAITASTTALAYDAGLVRIEPRPYYGAVVTIESGVRVFRPLPPQNLMIINPNRTPVSLSFNRTIEHKAADGGSASRGVSTDSDSGSRYGGITGLGNGIVGTNPQYGSGSAAGYGGKTHGKGHIRKRVQHH